LFVPLSPISASTGSGQFNPRQSRGLSDYYNTGAISRAIRTAT
jgi:hypothetical protein